MTDIRNLNTHPPGIASLRGPPVTTQVILDEVAIAPKVLNATNRDTKGLFTGTPVPTRSPHRTVR